MPSAARITDKNTGHSGYPSVIATEGSGNVYINGLAAHRTGDKWLPHIKSGSSFHTDSTGEGSSKVFINTKKAARVGDPIVNGGAIAQGSGNVFIG